MNPQERANDLFNRALGHFRQQQFSEANALLDPLLSLAPKAPPALNLKAVVVRELGRSDQALPYAIAAVTLAPADPVYSCNLGQTLADLGQHGKAIAAFEKGLRLFLARSGHPPRADALLLDLAEVAIDAPQALVEPSIYLERYGSLEHLSSRAASLRSALLHQVRGRDVLANSPDEATAQSTLHHLINIIGLIFNTPAPENRTTVETLVLPWLRQALEREWFDLALWLERELDLRYVHQIETEEHHTRHYRTVAPLMNQAGRRLRDRLPLVPGASAVNSSNVAFVVHDLVLRDVNRLLLDALRGMEKSGRSISVYVLSDVEPSAYQHFLASGARIIALSNECPHLRGKGHQLLLELRRRLAKEGTGAVLWATNISHMSFAFGLRLAPTQIWWSVQYHGVELEDIDGYLGASTLEKFKRIGNRDWRCVHGGISGLFDPSLTDQAQQIRRQFPVKILLGCMGRVEKLDNPQYLDAVTDILLARPEVGFLWTGQFRLPRVQERFEQAGVAERCFFAGWVNTALYAQVLDVCLDTFPFGGGITVSECMAAGRPAVFHLSPEAMESGIPMSVLPLLDGKVGSPEQQKKARMIFTDENDENLFLCARNGQEYTTMALRLIDDERFRAAVGQAGRQFVETFFMDVAEMARSMLEHIEEIISDQNTRVDA